VEARKDKMSEIKVKWKCDRCGKIYTYNPDFGLCYDIECGGRVSPIMVLIGYIDEDATCGLYQCQYCKKVALSSSGVPPTCGAEHDL